jgi:hypothetical protein
MDATPKDKITPAPARSGALAMPAGSNPLAAALAGYEEKKYNVVSPITLLDRVPPMHRVSIRVVQIDPETETYPIPGGDKLGLGKTALDKIAAAAGISWLPERCGQIDAYNHPHRVKYRAVCTIQDFDGRRRTIGAEKEVDLRGEPGSPLDKLGVDTREFVRVADSKAAFHMEVPTGTKPSVCRDCATEVFWVKTAKGRNVPLDADGTSHFATCPAKAQTAPGWDRVYQQRSNIHSLAESKAKLRCIRSALALPTSMTRDQVTKPFVVPALVPDLDVSDPEIKHMVAASLIGSEAALYGPQRMPPGARKPVQDEPEAIDVSYMTEAPEEPAAAPVPPAGPELPPEEPAMPACALPISEDLVAATAEDKTRNEYLRAINGWCAHALKHMPPDAAEAMFQKFGNGFNPLTATTAEMAGLIGALKTEIARVAG